MYPRKQEGGRSVEDQEIMRESCNHLVEPIEERQTAGIVALRAR